MAPPPGPTIARCSNTGPAFPRPLFLSLSANAGDTNVAHNREMKAIETVRMCCSFAPRSRHRDDWGRSETRRPGVGSPAGKKSGVWPVEGTTVSVCAIERRAEGGRRDQRIGGYFQAAIRD